MVYFFGWGVGGGNGKENTNLPHQLIVVLLFSVHTVHVHNYPKLTGSYIFVTLGNSEKVIFTDT